MSRIYISGAITGTDDFMERFQKAEEKLKEAGHMVYNPARANSYMPDGTSSGIHESVILPVRPCRHHLYARGLGK